MVTCATAFAGSIYDSSPLAKGKSSSPGKDMEPAVAGATSRLLDPDRINLWRVARSNRDGAALSFESFPFITYDRRPAKELSQFSVCWRMYRYRSEGRRRALDLFFIPIRWEKD